MSFYDKIWKSFFEAEKLINNTEILVKFTINLGGEKRVFVRALENLNNAVLLMLNAALSLEIFRKRVKVKGKGRENLDLFFGKFGKEYGIGQREEKEIREIIFLTEQHKESGMEFVKEEKLYVLMDDGKHYAFGKEELKIWLVIMRTLALRFKEVFKGAFKERYK